MRTTAIAVLALLTALTAAAGKIEAIDPQSITAGSGEQFIHIIGTELGDHVLYSGKAGEFDLEISARTERGVVAYVPDDIVNNPDRYTIYVRGDLGISGPAYLPVLEPFFSQPLVLLVPDPIAVPATSSAGAAVDFTVWPYGGSAPSPTVTCTHTSGAVFALGSTTVNCTATNSAGESASGQVFITVYDGGAPILKLPDRIVAIAESPIGIIVRFDAFAYDEIDGDLPVSCNPQSGATFPIGTTNVLCTAIDKALNVSEGTFEVVVENRGFLLLHIPDRVEAEAESANGTYVKFEAWADGTDDPNPVVKCDPESGSLFALGTSSVYCVASDRFGNSAEGRFDVSVVDSAPPMFANIYAKPDLLDPTGELVPVTVVWDVVDVVDPAPRCAIAGVWANQEITEADYRIISESEVALKAAADGTTDRIYSVNVLCTDAAQNSSVADANVRVPASKGQNASAPASPPSTKKRSTRH